MRRVLLASVLTFALLLPGISATAYTVTLNGFSTSKLTTYADDKFDPPVIERVNPAALPYSYTSSLVDGDAASGSVYTLSNTGFDITLGQVRTSQWVSFAQSTGDIYFSVDQNLSYVASGSYSVVDAIGRRVYFRAALYDFAVGSYAFLSLQWSDTTPNENFALGGTGGDAQNMDLGSLTGTLIAGHNYLFTYNAFLQTYPSPSTTGAAGVGSFSLTFVPEPSTALLLATGLVGLAARGRRKRA